MKTLRLDRTLLVTLSLSALLPLNCLAEGPAEEKSAGPDVLEIEVKGQRIANERPASTYSQPATQLRFDPLVDFQERNLGEAQGDVVIRGGTFETAGFTIGAAGVLDPQTGHYLTEVPLSPSMLTAPRRLTGVENALRGIGNGSGSVAYDFLPIQKATGEARFLFGDFRSNVQSIYLGAPLVGDETSEYRLGCDVDGSRSESNGSVPQGDHEFERAALRCQVLSSRSQTDLVAGYQDKYFQWPYLYALEELHNAVGSPGIESESIHTTLVMANHRMDYGDESFFELTPYYRHNSDNYEFDISRPGLFNPYEHTTDVWSIGGHGLHREDGFRFRYGTQGVTEELDSTALTFGEYQSRSRWQVSVLPGYEFEVGSGTTLILGVGAGYADSNRDDARGTPLGEVRLVSERSHVDREEVAFEVTQIVSLPGFTALASNPAAGLFRGNATLDATTSTSYEISGEVRRPDWSVYSSVFYRYDNELVDWTFTRGVQPFASRTANNVDIDTTGFELLVSKEFEFFTAMAGYFFLHKDEDYATDVDASFYALNFPEHRVTGALIGRPADWVEVRLDGEWRDQKENELRRSSDKTYFIASASAVFRPASIAPVEFGVIVDNLGNENFEEVPGVPGARRTAGGFVAVRF